MRINLIKFLLEWEETKKFINLKSVIKATSEDIVKFLDENASKKGKKSWLFVPKGSDNKICLVAHIDRIFDNREPKKIIKKKHGEKREWTSPQGISGDDRCGVYALLHLWRNLPNTHKPFLLFTHEEESGMFGAKEAVKVFADELNTVSYFIEMDRRGHKEMVFYNYDAPEFKKHIGKYDFEEKYGSASDISILGKKFKKSSVNVSVGYYDQHRKEEYIIVKHLMDSIAKVKNICIKNEPLSKEAATLPKPPKFKSTKYNWDDDYKAWGKGSMYDYEFPASREKKTYKYRVGDRITLIDHVYRKELIGKSGVIEKVTTFSSIPYDIKFDDGTSTYAEDKQLKPEKDVIEQEPKFKVGDKVTIIDHRYRKQLVGQNGVILKVNKFSNTYFVKLDDETMISLEGDEIKHIKETKKKQHKKADGEIEVDVEWENEAKDFAKKKSDEFERKRKEHSGD